MFISCFDSEPSKALQRRMLKDEKLSNALVRPSSRPMAIFDGCEKKGRAKVGKSRIILFVACSYDHCGQALSLVVYNLPLIADRR
jgi:hypothetical protein